MADEPKRIIDLTEVSSVAAGDYIAMDSEDGGTKKIPASHFTGGSGQVMWGGIQGDITQQEDLNGYLEQLPNKADIDGYYEDMSVGSAEQLLSNTYEPDSTPYLYRTSGGSLEIGDRVYEDAIVGGSVVWNQLVDIENPTEKNIAYVTYDATTHRYTVAYPENSSSASYILKFSLNMVEGHKYFYRQTIVAKSENFNMRFQFPWMNSVYTYSNSSSSMPPCFGNGTIFQRSSGNYESTNIGKGSAVTFAQSMTFEYEMHDLTLMFGSTIADYIYSLEQANTGAGVALFKALYPKDYYAYNAGGIESVKTSAKKVVGFNQFGGEIEFGNIDATGQDLGNSKTYIRTKDYTKVFPNTSYCFYFENSEQLMQGYLIQYDQNKTIISREMLGIGGNASTLKVSGYATTTTNVRTVYVRLFMYRTNDFSNVDNAKFCINFHWDGERDGEYMAYEEKTYPLDSDLELRGVPKLVDSKIKYDGDLYASDGTVTRRYGIVDLGTLDWTTTSASNVYITTNEITDMVRAGINDSPQLDILCGKYVATPTITLAVNMPDKLCSINSAGKKLMIKDSTYATASELKTALSGTYFVYPLETPTTESADPYTNPQWVDNWGTEQFIDERDVPVPVGHDSRYLPDLKAKTESAPNNPSTNGKYFLQYQNGEASYVPVPSEVPQTPSEEGTYVLKATVSGGTATLSWVAES